MFPTPPRPALTLIHYINMSVLSNENKVPREMGRQPDALRKVNSQLTCGAGAWLRDAVFCESEDIFLYMKLTGYWVVQGLCAHEGQVTRPAIYTMMEYGSAVRQRG